MRDIQEQDMKIYREKFWVELDSDGKVERMREVVLSLQSRINELEGLLIDLQQHEHGKSGRVVVAIGRRPHDYVVGTTSTREPATVWF